MTVRDEQLLDRFAAGLRGEKAPPLSAEAVETMLQRASAAQGAREAHKANEGPGWPLLATAAAVLLATGAGVGVWWQGPAATGASSAQPSPQPDKVAAIAPEATPPKLTSLVLPTGDRLALAPDTDFEVVSATASARRLSLRQGRLVVDAKRQPVPAGETGPAQTGRAQESGFEVQTPHARVVTLGTVFAVQVLETGTRLDVYEGRVAFFRNGERRVVAAGEHALAAVAEEAPIAEHPQLSQLGRQRAAERLAAKQQSPVVGREALPEEEAPSAEELAVAKQTAGGRLQQPRGAATSMGARPGRDRGPGPVGAVSVSLSAARDFVGAGEYGRALDAARADEGYRDGPWLMVAGDALRGLRRWGEALTVYRRVARGGEPGDRGQAAYLAAWVAFRKLFRAVEALEVLDEAQLLEGEGVLAERAFLLKGAALVQQGRDLEARAVCRRYLARFPNGAERAWAERIVASDSESPAESH